MMVKFGHKYRLIGHMTQMRRVFVNGGGEDNYFVFLGELVEVSSALYADYTLTGRKRAMEQVSDIFQISLFEEDADEFFISSEEFAVTNYDILENFLNEKLGIIIAFVRRALYNRKRELGIYSVPSEFDEKVILEEAGRSKLFLN